MIPSLALRLFCIGAAWSLTAGAAETHPTPEAKLAALGLALPSVPPVIANYVPAVRSGNLVFLAGQIARGADGKFLAGKVGRDFTEAQGADAARTWPTLEEQAQIFGPAQEARRLENPHRESIARWLLKTPLAWSQGVTSTEVCIEALGLKAGELRPGRGTAWSNVAAVMRSLGWQRNDSTKRYRFCPGVGPSRDDLQAEFATGGAP